MTVHRPCQCFIRHYYLQLCNASENICRGRIKLSTLRTGKVESQSALLCLLPLQVEVMLYFCEQSGVCHMQGAILDIPLVSSDKTEASVAASVRYTPELPKVDI